jgi:hypothetical protein
MVWTGAIGAASAAAYYVWEEFERRAEDGRDKRNDLVVGTPKKRSGIEIGMENLDETCKMWEVALQQAIASGDVAKANRIRLLLRRAYATVETFNSSFGDSVGPPKPLFTIRPRGSGDNPTGSEASFMSAETSQNYEQDLVGFEGGGGGGGGAADRDDGELVTSTPARGHGGGGGVGGDRRFGGDASTLVGIPPSPISLEGGVAPEDMWTTALRLEAAGKIKYRKDRSTECGVTTGDFGARVHCYRQAMGILAANEEYLGALKQMYYKAMEGVFVLNGFGDDPQKLVEATETLIEFIRSEMVRDGGMDVKDEVAQRNIPELTMYDLCWEFVLFDSMDDMKNPPKTVTAVLQNSWVPQAVRARALRGVLWTALTSKRSVLNKRTFAYHFYGLCSHISPPLAAGMLGVGNQDFTACIENFTAITLGWIKQCFAIPGTVENLTPEVYADMIIAIARVDALKVLEPLAEAIRKLD